MSNLFARDKNQFMRRWELLTHYVEMIEDVLGYGTDTQKADLLRFVYVTLDHPNDEVPMRLVNYVRGYILSEQKLPSLKELQEVKYA